MKYNKQEAEQLLTHIETGSGLHVKPSERATLERLLKAAAMLKACMSDLDEAESILKTLAAPDNECPGCHRPWYIDMHESECPINNFLTRPGCD